jgi:transcriptional regulator with XRE-family HTH domain
MEGLMAQQSRRPLTSVFGTIVAEKRKLQEMSQEELAEKVGISQVALSRMEKGIIAPRFERLQNFADALGCSVSELFPPPEKHYARAADIADIITCLSDEQQKELIEIAAKIVKITRPKA